MTGQLSKMVGDGRPAIAVVTDYASLVEAIRLRLDQLGTSHLGFDRSVGMADGHTDKILCGTKNIGPLSFNTIMKYSAMKFIAVEDEKQIEKVREILQQRETPVRMRSILRKPIATWLFNAKKARRLVKKRWANSSAEEKTKAARRAAKARWAKVRRMKRLRAKARATPRLLAFDQASLAARAPAPLTREPSGAGL